MRCDTLLCCIRNIWDVSDMLKWLSWPHGRCSCRKRLRLSWPDGYVRQIAGYNTGEDDARARYVSWAIFEILRSTGKNRDAEEEEPLTRARVSMCRVCLSRRTRQYFQVARNLRRSTCMHVFWVHPFSSRRDRRQREQSMLPCNPESRRMLNLWGQFASVLDQPHDPHSYPGKAQELRKGTSRKS